ncbi:MAG: hypothetical protein ABI380_04130, partial [Edaphobacter sp.]
MSSTDLDSKFKGVWLRALNEPALENLTPELIVEWAVSKGLVNPVASARDVGPLQPTPSIVLEVDGGKACFPKMSASGDSSWQMRRRAKEDEALLWKKMEWFAPLWLPTGKIREMLSAVRHSTNQRAIEIFDYHTSTLYTLAFKAVCIAQIMPLARSLQEIVPLAREAYLGFYSGYKASSIAALIPAMEGSLTRIVADLNPRASAHDKIDHAINRAIRTAADLHFERMWVPDEYKTVEYLFGQDERVFAFETFRRWLKDLFFCNTDSYQGLTWLNRHMFAHGTASSWQQQANFSRLLVALTTLAAIESWYDESHSVSFRLPPMNDDGTLLWQRALLQADVQMKLKVIEQDVYQKHGRLVPEMPADKGVTLRSALLSEDCMNDLVRPLRDAGWSVEVNEPDGEALSMTVVASCGKKHFSIALLYSCATDNSIYQMLAETCVAILYRGAPYQQEAFARGVAVHVGPVLGWQPPRPRCNWRSLWKRFLDWIHRCAKAV